MKQHRFLATEVFPSTDDLFDRPVHEMVCRINAGQPISRTLARDALLEVLHLDSDSQRSALLGVILAIPQTVLTEDVAAGYIDAISAFEGNDIVQNKKKLTVPKGKRIVGLAGSGKKGVKTVNITTPSMILATAMGTYCAKAGSRSTSSLMGSVDLLEQLGIKIPKTYAAQEAIFNTTRFGFFSIEDAIMKFDERYGNRFFAPHALSLVLPAVVLPVKVDVIMYGYAAPNIYLSARSLMNLGYKNLFIVNNTNDLIHYVDEMLPTGMTNIIGVVKGAIGRTRSFEAGKFVGLANDTTHDTIFQQTSREAQTEMIKKVLQGEMPDTMLENAICLNAATIAYIAGDAKNPQEGFEIARETIRSGKAFEQLEAIIKASREH
ncbi:MAG: hypothetical protein WAQ27_04790 [Candidatus Microsaccharimonas sp.]